MTQDDWSELFMNLWNSLTSSKYEILPVFHSCGVYAGKGTEMTLRQ